MLIRRGGADGTEDFYCVCHQGNGKNMFIVAIKPESSPGEYLSLSLSVDVSPVKQKNRERETEQERETVEELHVIIAPLVTRPRRFSFPPPRTAYTSQPPSASLRFAVQHRVVIIIICDLRTFYSVVNLSILWRMYIIYNNMMLFFNVRVRVCFIASTSANRIIL